MWVSFVIFLTANRKGNVLLAIRSQITSKISSYIQQQRHQNQYQKVNNLMPFENIHFENYLDSDLHIDTSNAISIGCGDYPHYIVSAGYEDYQVLGSVPLSEEKTYLSCRELCRQRYPSFDFYHKFVNYQSCDCIKMVSETPIKIRTHDAYTFGYAEECISRYLAWL